MDNEIAAGERLQKVLAQEGIGSRREIERWITAGRITVNGKTAILGVRVSSADKITLDGKVVRVAAKAAKTRVLALNKPEGVICTARDPGGRPTAQSLLPSKDGARWIGVGRLDINTSGLLLFANNGDLANALMHPRFEIDRVCGAHIRERRRKHAGSPSVGNRRRWRNLCLRGRCSGKRPRR